MIRRVLDASFLNTVANHTDVRPWLGVHEGPIDLQPVLDECANVALQTEHGGIVLQQTEPGVYEGHTLFLPDGRGREALACVRETLAYIFVKTNGVEIVTKVPAGNEAALGLARLGGLRPLFTVKGTFQHQDGPQDLTAYGITYDQWVVTAPETEKAGAEFHKCLEAAKETHGSTTPVHEDDPVHDRFAGFTALCAYAGNAAKGVHLYNRWARLAGYAQIALRSEHPVIIDILDAVLTVNAQDSFEVVQCR